jgi:ABC-2 type transport system ATP-binding protein
VFVDGRPLTTRSVQAKRAVGLVPQELAIYPDLTARENLNFFGRLYGIPGGELKARVDEVLHTIGLADRANDRSEEYSGGMKRRLNIGIGLLHRPRLLILDEPTVGVDPQSRNAILESVEQLSVGGMAVLYTTHYMEEAERLCDRVGIIDAGRIVAEGTRRELVELVGQHDRVRMLATGNLQGAARELGAIAGVESADVRDGGIDLLARHAADQLPEILSRIAKAGASVSNVRLEEPNLEAVFLHLTGKALRD